MILTAPGQDFTPVRFAVFPGAVAYITDKLDRGHQ